MPKRLGIMPVVWQRRYNRTVCQVRKRQEEWAFTPETWWQVWQATGMTAHYSQYEWHTWGKPGEMDIRIHQSQRGLTGCCMVRLDPTEAWGPHNCIVVSRAWFFRRLNRWKAQCKRYGWHELEFDPKESVQHQLSHQKKSTKQKET